jgi:mono/diheme cytochrome c family protein
MKSALIAFVALLSLLAPQKEGERLSKEEEEKAERIVVEDCLACHAKELLSEQRITAQQWEAVIKKMEGWGAPLEEGEGALLARYLSERYGVDEPAAEIKTISSIDAMRAIARLPDGQFAAGSAKDGKAKYQELCAKCHGADAKGESFGVALAEKPAIFRAPELAEAVRKGRGRMPAFPDLGDKSIAAIIAYLRILRD